MTMRKWSTVNKVYALYADDLDKIADILLTLNEITKKTGVDLCSISPINAMMIGKDTAITIRQTPGEGYYLDLSGE